MPVAVFSSPLQPLVGILNPPSARGRGRRRAALRHRCGRIPVLRCWPVGRRAELDGCSDRPKKAPVGRQGAIETVASREVIAVVVMVGYAAFVAGCRASVAFLHRRAGGKDGHGCGARAARERRGCEHTLVNSQWRGSSGGAALSGSKHCGDLRVYGTSKYLRRRKRGESRRCAEERPEVKRLDSKDNLKYLVRRKKQYCRSGIFEGNKGSVRLRRAGPHYQVLRPLAPDSLWGP